MNDLESSYSDDTENNQPPAEEMLRTNTTKAFFADAVEKVSHRDAVRGKVKEVILEEKKGDSVTPQVIHLGQCNWEAVGEVVSPTYFVMMVCRKFGLLTSERCVLLSLRDQFQAIQLCLAKINKKKHGDFDAPISDVLDVWHELYRDTVSDNNTLNILKPFNIDKDDCDLNLPSSRRESYDPVIREMQEIVAEYQDFLQTSRCIDHFTLYTALKDHMKNSQDVVEYIHSKIYIIEGASQMPAMELELIKLLLSNAHVLKVTAPVPSVADNSLCDFDMSGIGEDTLNSSQTAKGSNNETRVIDLISSIVIEQLDCVLDDYIEELPKVPSTTDLSESELYVEQLILSHIRLLINTRDELALATLCSMPGREINQQGFYQIKDEAQKKNMPLYPTILSFIMRLRLGGKGYQADPNCPLLLHSKPLGEFVDSIMKLQNIVEEEPNPRKGAVKVLSLIKSGLLRIRGRSLKGSCIERVWDSLYSAFERLIDTPNEDEESGGPIKTPKNQQTTGALRPCLKLLAMLCDEASGRLAEEIVEILGENFLTQCSSSKKMATPIRIPTVFSLFRSPVRSSPAPKLIIQEDEGDSLRMRLMKSKGLTPQNTSASRFQSGCSWAPDDLSPVCKAEENLDSTISPIIGPTLKAFGGDNSRRSSAGWREIVEAVAVEEEEKRKEVEAEALKQRGSKKTANKSKRSLLSDISNITVDSAKKSKTSVVTKSVPSKKKSKTIPILKGQKCITSFFKP